MSEHWDDVAPPPFDPAACQDIEVLRALVQAVRKACDGYEPEALRPGDWWAGYYTARNRILRVLNGGDV